MRKLEIEIGSKFNKWTFIKKLSITNGRSMGFFRCDCGTKRKVNASKVVGGFSKSCGCSGLSKNKTHGMSRNPFYIKWTAIKGRCLSKTDKDYKRYGGREITISKSWLKFENFQNDMHDSYVEHLAVNGSKNTSIDRINNDGNYCKENCRWATQKEQGANRRTNRVYEVSGKKKILADWIRESGKRVSTIRYRLQKGMSFEDAITKLAYQI